MGVNLLVTALAAWAFLLNLPLVIQVPAILGIALLVVPGFAHLVRFYYRGPSALSLNLNTPPGAPPKVPVEVLTSQSLSPEIRKKEPRVVESSHRVFDAHLVLVNAPMQRVVEKTAKGVRATISIDGGPALKACWCDEDAHNTLDDYEIDIPPNGAERTILVARKWFNKAECLILNRRESPSRTRKVQD